jgi:glycosyltransferase involved in cell wall biosynthesis
MPVLSEATAESSNRLGGAPLISVVITTSSVTRLRGILKLIDSIEAQVYPHIEVICVVERAMGLAKLIDQRALNMHHEMRVLYFEKTLGANTARNIGISSAAGDIIAFVDDDAQLDPNWAEAIVRAYEDDKVVGITGPVIPLWEDASMSWWPCELEWVVGCSGWIDGVTKRRVRGVLGTNASFRRNALAETRYNEQFGPKGHDQGERNEWNEIGEETELSLRVRDHTKGTIIFDPNVIVYHQVPRYKTGQRFVLQRAFQVGRTKRILSRNKRYDRADVLGPEARLLGRLLIRMVLPRKPIAKLSLQVKATLEIVLCVLAVALGYTLA